MTFTKKEHLAIEDQERDEINGEIEHLIWKRDLDDFDLMKFHNETKSEVYTQLKNYFDKLVDGLEESYFDHKEYFELYKGYKEEFKADQKQLEDCMIDYQPVIFTNDIDQILKNNHLADTRQNRWCIAILLRKVDVVNADIMAAVLFKAGVMQGDGTEEDLINDLKNAEVTVQRVGDTNGK